MEKVFDKLVRDNIPSIIENNGEVAITEILKDEDYINELYKKLLVMVKVLTILLKLLMKKELNVEALEKGFF